MKFTRENCAFNMKFYVDSNRVILTCLFEGKIGFSSLGWGYTLSMVNEHFRSTDKYDALCDEAWEDLSNIIELEKLSRQ